ncbi:type II toxin-antitoxin system RelB/DinJ family antitoxin [Halomonas sp. HK25]|uniref:type II toxin-antitoxin system RelB/DinJ family antitoxin n=1 Tax=Halomonas sp. HK25 TaxID=3394321 RepID=UPI0039FD33A2
MSADTVVRARIDSETKKRASAALEEMGLSVSDAIRLLMMRIAEEKRLPFEVQVPKTSTLEAMDQLESGKGKRFDDADELFQDLKI